MSFSDIFEIRGLVLQKNGQIIGISGSVHISDLNLKNQHEILEKLRNEGLRNGTFSNK